MDFWSILNFLDSGRSPDGVPVHVILRAILDSSTIDEALKTIEPFKGGKSANILMGDANGKHVDIEFANDRVYHPAAESSVFIHTNHYLGDEGLNKDVEKLASSFARYERGIEVARGVENSSIDEMKAILLDRASGDLPICRHYVADPDIGNVGTTCTVIMDLEDLELHITRGNPLNNIFERIKVQD